MSLGDNVTMPRRATFNNIEAHPDVLLLCLGIAAQKSNSPKSPTKMPFAHDGRGRSSAKANARSLDAASAGCNREGAKRNPT